MIRRAPLLLLLSLLAAMASGCIDADYQCYLRHDKEKDSFSCLHVFSDIASDNERELKYLHARMQKKASILIVPAADVPDEPVFFAFARLDGQMVHELDLAQPPKNFKENLTFSEPFKFPVDLTPIKIRPGNFFLNERKNLCYWHEMHAPGPVVDQLLVVLNKAMCQELLLPEVDAMIEAEDDPKLPRITWDDYRKKIAEDIQGKVKKAARKKPAEKKDPADKKLQEKGPFELASLKALRKAAAANQLGMKRKGSRLSLELPFTKGDSQQLIATLDYAKKVFLGQLKKKQKDPKLGVDDQTMIAAWEPLFANSLVYNLVPGKGVHFEVELTRAFATFNQTMEIASRKPIASRFIGGLTAEQEAKYQAECKAALEAMQDRRIEVLRDFDARKLLAPYLSAAQ
jgi:hypothetical protein